MIYFRLAQEGEILQIESIIRDAYKPIADALSRPPGVLENTLEKLNSDLRNNQLYAIYNGEKNLIGTFSLAFTDRNTVKMSHFAIKPQFQSKGSGSRIISEVTNMIQRKMPLITGIELEIYYKTPNLLEFYKKFGFNQIGEKRIRGEKILILSKQF